MFYKKSYSEELCYIYKKTHVLEFLFNKVAGMKVCEYCAILKKSYFEEHLYIAVSNYSDLAMFLEKIFYNE